MVAVRSRLRVIKGGLGRVRPVVDYKARQRREERMIEDFIMAANF